MELPVVITVHVLNSAVMPHAHVKRGTMQKDCLALPILISATVFLAQGTVIARFRMVNRFAPVKRGTMQKDCLVLKMRIPVNK